MYARNAASPERVAIGSVVQISDGAVQTSGVSVKVVPQGGSGSAGGGTIGYEEGVVHYLPTQAETNYTSFMLIAYKTGCLPAPVTVVTTASATSGYAGLDWALIANKTTTHNLSATTIKTATDVETDTADIQSRIPAALVSGRMDASTGAMAANVLTASALATDAVTEIQTGLATPTNITSGTITTVTNLTNAPTAGDLTTTMKTSVATATWAAAARTLTAGTNIVLAKGTGLTGLNDLSAAAVNAEVDTAISDVGLTTTITGRIDVASSTRLASASYAAPPSVASIADGVWDESISGHLAGGSTGAALNAAGSAGDPWSTPLPGAYSSGTAGYIVGTNIDAPVSTAGGGLDAAGVRAALGMTAADLDAQIDTLATASALATVDGIVGTLAVGVNVTKWNGTTPGNLDGNGFLPANLASINGSTGRVAEFAGQLDADEVGSILATTAKMADTLEDDGGTFRFTANALEQAPSGSGLDAAGVRAAIGLAAADLDAQLASLPTATENADALLNRDMAAVSDTNSRSPLNALRFVRNGFSISGATLTVLKEDDTTAAFTRDLTTDASADPITGVN